MALSHEEVQRLKHRQPGWERLWAKLCEDLIPALDRATHRLGVRWPDESLREEFVADVLLKYQGRANRGTLLTGYNCACADSSKACGDHVVVYLTGRTILHCWALDFLGHWGPLPDGGNEPDGEEPPAPERGTRPPGKFDLLREIQCELERQVNALPPGADIPQWLETGGIQLYPHLNWSRLARLKAWLEKHIPTSAPQWKDCFHLLGDLHRRAEEQFIVQLNDVTERIWNKGKVVGPKGDLRLRKRCDELDFERLILPLSAAAVKELLGIEVDAAAQRRSRYRRALARLPRLRDLYEDLGEFDDLGDSLEFEEDEDGI